MERIRPWRLLAVICTAALSLSLAHAQVVGRINFQGHLTDSAGQGITGDSTIVFSLYDVPAGGTPLWSETHLVTVNNGVFAVDLGQPGNELNPADFAGNRFLGIRVASDPEMTPRLQITADALALRASLAEDSLRLDGRTAADLDQSEHVVDVANPHGVSAAQVGAIGPTELAAHADNVSAHHVKTVDASELTTGLLADNVIPPDITRDIELTWSNIADIPEGFADGTDDDSGGDITAVQAGNGLSGGGISGEISLEIAVPLNLAAATSRVNAIVSGTNTGNGYGVHGWSASNFGVYGFSPVSPGVQGYSTNNAGVSGLNASWGNEGKLGDNSYGVYGKAMSSLGAGVYGIHNATANKGILGTQQEGVYGLSSVSSGIGVAGVHLGDGTGVFGQSSDGYAGDFDGVLRVSKAGGPQLIIHDTDDGSSKPGIQFTNNSLQYFAGDDLTEEVFGIYSLFSSSREHDTELRVHGRAGDSWGTYISLTHDGTDGYLGTDVGDLILNPAGNIGIGTNSPVDKLEVQGGGLTLDGAEGLSIIRFRQNDTMKWTLFTAPWLGSDDLRIRNESRAVDVVAIDSDTNNVGIKTNTPTEALEVNGNIRTSGEVIWTPKTSYCFIPPYAFQPQHGSMSYSGWWDTLRNTSDLVSISFYAPVELPHGAIVVNVSCWWTDRSASNGEVTMIRFLPSSGSYTTMATLTSQWNDSERHMSYDDSISVANINNNVYGYALSLHLPAGADDVFFHGVRIEYVTTGPH